MDVPPGTVFIKHFELGLDDSDPTKKAKLETRFLVIADTGDAYGLTYRWNDAGTEAFLLDDAETRTISIESPAGPRQQTWTFPGRQDCVQCHNPGLSTFWGSTRGNST